MNEFQTFVETLADDELSEWIYDEQRAYADIQRDIEQLELPGYIIERLKGKSGSLAAHLVILRAEFVRRNGFEPSEIE